MIFYTRLKNFSVSSPHPVWFVCKTYIGSWTWQPMSAKSLALSHQGPWRCSVWLLVRSYTSVQWSKLDQCTAVYSSSLSSLAHHQKWVFRQCFILQWNRHIHHKKITKNIQIGNPQKKKRCLGLCPKPFDPSSSPRHSPGILAFLLVNIAKE